MSREQITTNASAATTAQENGIPVYGEFGVGYIESTDGLVAKIRPYKSLYGGAPKFSFIYRNHSDFTQLTMIALTKHGVSRVLDGHEGMVFVVNSLTKNGDRIIAHVEDDRHEEKNGKITIWSLGPEDWRAPKFGDTVTRP